MDNDPKTRKESKGGKKGPKNSIYNSRRVREIEALAERKKTTPQQQEAQNKKN